MVVRVYCIEWGPARSCLAMAGGLMRMRGWGSRICSRTEKDDFDPKKAVLRSYLAQIMKVSLQCQPVGTVRPQF